MAKSGSFGVGVNWPGGQAEIRWNSATESANNRSLVTVELWGKTSGFTTGGGQGGYWELEIDGQTSVRGSAPLTVSGSWKKLASWSRYVGHSSDGSKSAWVGVRSGSMGGTSWTSTSFTTRQVELDDFDRRPAAVYGRSVSNITAVSARISWGAPSANGTLRQYHYRVRTPPNSGGTILAEGYTDDSRRYVDLTNLPPGTLMGFIVQAENQDGWGDWSDSYAEFETLPGGRRKVDGVWRDIVRWRKTADGWKRTRRWKKTADGWRPTR
ncbi:fibronectin type III domain-containing protein [Microbacterium sp. UBA3394]|uniref:fibronectin type III domain-containing protein n=1 Tax=Microbacterium sp. UBA3394 TaxID=1946945 RepID=UPI000C38062F|nr:fibronectin type III domain-containing protein [Microbacterium sp. UBA3394]MAB20231.1 hypothetical protein [Microbacterium sp.]MAM53533.1 hypothetical protein [Microbacterium sp.]|tara:strand:+ start:19706 stop:20509 length:804 start_codon:yes stop_codon:yes gene_type:complete